MGTVAALCQIGSGDSAKLDAGCQPNPGKPPQSRF
jgi:hypothetical protein